MGKTRHLLGTFSGLGTGLMNFCAAVSCFVSMIYKNINFTNCVRFAVRITRSRRQHSLPVVVVGQTLPGRLVLQGFCKGFP